MKTNHIILKNFISSLILLIFSQFSYGALAISPAPSSGELNFNSSGSFIYFSNTGSSNENLLLQVDTNSQGIGISVNRCPAVLKPNKSCYIFVSYPNYNRQAPMVSLNLKNNGSNLLLLKFSPLITAIVESISVSPSSIDFGSFSKLTSSSIRNVVITNNGNSIINPVLTTPSSVDIVLNRCSNLKPNASCTVSLKFNPNSSMSNGQQSGLLFNAKPSVSSSSVSSVNLLANLNLPVLTPQMSGISFSGDKKTVTISGNNLQNVNSVKILNGATEIDNLIIESKTVNQLVLKFSKDITLLSNIDYIFRLL